MGRRYALRDDQWDVIKGLIPGREETVDATARDNRLFVEAVLYRYRAGIPWRDLPERFGDWKNVHRRFSQWAQSGVLEAVFAHLASDADNEYAMIDSTIVRAHQHSAGAVKKNQDQAIGRSKGGLSTKTHATVDALGNPTGFHLTGGQACDLDGADALLPDINAKNILADKVYDADVRVIEPLARAGKTAAIPPKHHRTNMQWYVKPGECFMTKCGTRVKSYLFTFFRQRNGKSKKPRLEGRPYCRCTRLPRSIEAF
jgi:transposase